MKTSSTLHLLMNGEPQVIAACAAFVLPGDAVLLLGSGVHLLGEQLLQWRDRLPPECLVSALEADAVSRGLESRALKSQVPLISDSEWVGKVCASHRVLSWK